MVTVLGLVAALGVLSVASTPRSAMAHAIVVDGAASEWFGTPAATPDLGRVSRRADGGGEYVWRDAVGDARAVWPAGPHDLLELRVTGDPARLYLMARLAAPVATSGDSVPQLQVAIDLDHFFYSGGTAFADSAATETGGPGAYEWLVQTRFGSGQSPRLVDAWGNAAATGAQAAISPGGVIEVSVPWSDLGQLFVPVNPVRFTAALFLARADDVPLDPRDGTASRVADLVTQNAGPGLGGTTLGEVADGVADYAFDLWFGPRGDVVAPLVVSEAHFETGLNSQWIEVANATQGVVAAGAFRVGDEETPGGNEGMARLPAGTLLVPGQVFVIARHGATFLADWGVRADAECDPSDDGTPDMQAHAPWAAQAAFNITSSGDHLVVLDGANTIVDLLVFKNASYPGVTPSPGMSAGQSLERLNPGRDTDDCAADFRGQPAPTPFTAPAVTAQASGPSPGPGPAWAAVRPNPARGRVSLTLRPAGGGRLAVGIYDATGRLAARLFEGVPGPGEMRLEWDTRDADGRAVPPGLYFARATAPGTSATVKLAVVR